MLVQVMLERALTSMLADNMKTQGTMFFEALEQSGQLNAEQIQAIRTEWETLIEKRAQESAGSSEALHSLLDDLRQTLGSKEKS